MLVDLQHREGKSIVIVEQNARKALQVADVAYLLLSGEVAIVGNGAELLHDRRMVSRLYLGG
jgi:branched-chain amino acid transport system ATP-binding protein